MYKTYENVTRTHQFFHSTIISGHLRSTYDTGNFGSANSIEYFNSRNKVKQIYYQTYK